MAYGTRPRDDGSLGFLFFSGPFFGSSGFQLKPERSAKPPASAVGQAVGMQAGLASVRVSAKEPKGCSYPYSHYIVTPSTPKHIPYTYMHGSFQESGAHNIDPKQKRSCCTHTQQIDHQFIETAALGLTRQIPNAILTLRLKIAQKPYIT